ncbi:MAG: gamma-glutamylcyclotransferase family protein [Bryobacteraceae bacterium]|nr:gamma-glutamylcyclotransferase family protein [Bryobacteraceae bacterium]
MTRLLFTYGSLQRGFTNRAARLLRERGEYVGDAVIRADLHWPGRWPFITPGRGRVGGEVFRIPTSLLRCLNAYEGAAYRLRPTLARTAGGTKLRVWAYWAA